MAGLLAGARARLTEIRHRRPMLDHALLMQEHYGTVKASQWAGAVTYFAFLSFFPLLALAVFVVGWASEVYPQANADLRRAIDEVVPGVIGSREDGKVSLREIRTFSGWVAVFGLAGVLYSGLGWLSALRDALLTVFDTPPRDQPGFIPGKLRDLVTLVTLGAVLFVAVAVTGFVSGFSHDVLGWVGLGAELGWLVKSVTVLLGLAANTVLFFLMFRLLAEPRVPARSLWSGALTGALVFEVLKQASGFLLAYTKDQPAFQAFGIALILVVWMNYTSRVILYAAAWAHTTREARALRLANPPDPVQGPRLPTMEEHDEWHGAEDRPTGRAAFAAGAVAGGALTAVLGRLGRGRGRDL